MPIPAPHPAAPPGAPPARVPPVELPGLNALLTVFVAVVVVAALYVGREVFVPVVLAILLSFVLAPLVALLRRIHLPRVAAVFVAILLAIGVIGAIAGIIGLQVAQLAADLPRYEATLMQKVEGLRSASFGRVGEALQHINQQIEKTTENQPPAQADPGETQKPVLVEVKERSLTPFQLAHQVLGPVLHPLAIAGIVLVVAVFILMQQADLRDRVIRLLGSHDLHRTTVAMDDAARRLSRYFLTQLALNAGFGMVIAVGLWLIGVPSPILWGVTAGLLRFIPYVGGVVAAALPAILAAAVDPTGWTMALWTILLFLVVEPVLGHVIEPMLYGHSTGLSPFAVVISAIFWTWLWGPIGLLLATPFTVVLVVIGRHVDRLEFLDVLLGDQPALTPIENFYQRLLAGDADEAQEQAEVLLKERSLSSYYDEVALKGLQLAADDATRGVLTAAQLETIRAAMEHLVQDLDEYDDVDPPPKAAPVDPAAPPRRVRELPVEPAVQSQAPHPVDLPEAWRSGRAILCIAGRGPLDDGASAMLAQLLRKHGLGAQVEPHESASRKKIGQLDLNGVAMVCVSYLEIKGNPAALRYLLRRLRQRLPKTPILVGLWPTDAAVLKDEELRRTTGADHYVTSLREAVKACLDEAHRAAGLEPPAEPEKAPAAPAREPAAAVAAG